MILIILFVVVIIVLIIVIWYFTDANQSTRIQNDPKIIRVNNTDYGHHRYYITTNIELLKLVDGCEYRFYSNAANKTDRNNKITSISYKSKEGKFVSYLRHGDFPETEIRSNYDYSVNLTH